MDRLDELESQSVYILREAFANFKNLVMLWSIGKDSTVLLWLARKAFFGHVPIPLVHIDTAYKIPEMIKYRDELALKWNLNMVYGQNKKALEEKNTFPDGKLNRVECCKVLKTQALRNTLSGEWPRFRLNHSKEKYELDSITLDFFHKVDSFQWDDEKQKVEFISEMLALTPEERDDIINYMIEKSNKNNIFI